MRFNTAIFCGTLNIMCIFLCVYILWVLRKESREKNEKKRKMNKDDKESYDND